MSNYRLIRGSAHAPGRRIGKGQEWGQVLRHARGTKRQGRALREDPAQGQEHWRKGFESAELLIERMLALGDAAGTALARAAGRAGLAVAAIATVARQRHLLRAVSGFRHWKGLADQTKDQERREDDEATNE
ncbi:hypothetical protein D3C87_1624130 [compost metagenome]